ncbi:hypothetical protein AQV86_03620 [Nanohaloarchaea archaeon SG9]|nr:hypothetical protein AQV86_03620 [Nanohaloarchaea archaeon SG9]
MKEKIRKATRKVLKRKPEKINEMEEGLMHETYSVTVDGEKYIVQFSGREDDSLKHNLKCYELFQDTVPVPETVTREVQEVNGQKFTTVEKVQGESAEKNVNPERTRNAGKTLARIHSKASFPHEGWMEMKKEDQTPEELLEGLQLHSFEKGSLKRRKIDNMYNEKIPVLRENGFGVADSVEEFLRKNEGLFPENFTAVPCHLDFSPDNVIYRGKEISGVIDFDYMYAGLDVRDLVKSANSFWMHDPAAEWSVREEFYRGYQKVRDLPENFEELEAFFRIETIARLVASVIDLDEMNEDEKEFYREELKKELVRCREKVDKHT